MSDREATTASSMVEEVSSEKLGFRVKELRRVKGLTLNDLAESSGVSRAMISKIERGEKNPTLVVAARLSEGLGVTLSQLAGTESRREVTIIPGDGRMVMRDPETGFERQLLSPTFGNRGVEFIRNVISEGSTSGEFPEHHRGVEEYIVVEKGCMAAILDGEKHVLEEGDAIYFEADITHRFDNVGVGECSYYLVIDSGGT